MKQFFVIYFSFFILLPFVGISESFLDMNQCYFLFEILHLYLLTLSNKSPSANVFELGILFWISPFSSSSFNSNGSAFSKDIIIKYFLTTSLQCLIRLRWRDVLSKPEHILCADSAFTYFRDISRTEGFHKSLLTSLLFLLFFPHVCNSSWANGSFDKRTVIKNRRLLGSVWFRLPILIAVTFLSHYLLYFGISLCFTDYSIHFPQRLVLYVSCSEDYSKSL